MAERPHFHRLSSTLNRRDVESALLARAKEAETNLQYTYNQYLERIALLRQLAKDLDLECVESIQVSVSRGSARYQNHTPPSE